MKKLIIFIPAIISFFILNAQEDQTLNAITTAVPFLTLTPNAYERGIGEIGVVSLEDNFEAGMFSNPALLSKGEKAVGAKVSVLPWLRNLIAGMNIYDIGSYYAIDERNSVSLSFYYFDLGEVYLYSLSNDTIINNPHDYAINLRYAHSFTDYFSVGTGIKYFVSRLGQDMIEPEQQVQIRSYAVDFGLEYRNKIHFSDSKFIRYDLGLSILNIGPKVSYIKDSDYKDFIPTTLAWGTMWTYERPFYTNQVSFSLAYQAQKLLVPTPEIITEGEILGLGSNVSAFKGMYQSFYDAPYGFREELHEIIHKLGGKAGLDMSNDITVALRTGYFYEHYTKGNRQFLTGGIGCKYKYWYLDFGFILYSEHIPLSNTVNLNVGFQKTLK